MSDNHLYFYPDQDQPELYHWPWVCAHGELEGDNGHDMGLFSDCHPEKGGVFHGLANHKDIIVRLVMIDGLLEGRVAYIDDVLAMQYVFDETRWR